MKTPKKITFRITPKCNANCNYCILRKDKGSLNISTLYKVTKQITKIGNIKEVYLHGGEPLTLGKRHLSKIIDILQENKIRVLVQTNGYNLTEEIIELLKNKKIGVGISIDNIIKEDKYGLEDKIQKLSDLNMTPGNIAVLTKENIYNLIEIYEYFKAIGLKTLSFNTLYSSKVTQDLHPSTEEWNNRMINFFDYYMEDKNKIIVNPFNDIITYLIKSSTRCCSTGNYHCQDIFACIDFNGNVFPCNRIIDKSFSFGNILTDNTKTIWNNPLRKGLKRHKLQKKCEECEYKKPCGIRCLVNHCLTDNKIICKKELIVHIKNKLEKMVEEIENK